MVLFFTALHEKKKIKIFSFQPGTLELGLDLINIVSAQGDAILSAHIVDENGATEIPLDVFDGTSFSAPMQALEKQWKKLLKKPAKPVISQHTQELIGLLRKKIQIHTGMIAHLDSTIIRLEALLVQANKIGSARLLNHYTTLIHKYQQGIAKARRDQKLSIDKLNLLEQL
ncbi:hypothetical protein [Spirosoma endophyticum]|uniref:Uncharacterized protein n=1 Tax=Spirosoma endophyticum TaxID=662367 RepID=A0A1I1FPL1_9BACT|nr:hypothetical protein [Spirosoma endophyticum]SFC01211.1 hypothetical protein SAMN05216167_101278 [Spirosoma endophyticum]